MNRVKPEHMTHLDHKTLVAKDHPRIAFRGWIDRLEAEILVCRLAVLEQGEQELAGELEELLAFVRGLIRCDVLGEPVGEISLCGYTAGQLRETSHHPELYLGQGHFVPSPQDLPTLIYVNRLRTLIRQAELACFKAFRGYDGTVTRPDLMEAMNRLSSLCWIWECRLKAREKGREPV